MSKKSKNDLINQNGIQGIQEVKYHFSLKMKFLLFFTIYLWIIPFLITSIIAAIKFYKQLEKFQKEGYIDNPDFKNIKINSLEFYNRYLELKNANKKLFVSETMWQEMKVEEIFIETFDKEKLATFIIKAKEETNKWVVVCHGWAQSRYSILYLAMPFYYAGYNVLIYDFRNHGKSSGNVCTFGIKESQDLFYVVKYLNDNIDRNSPKKIVLIGNSMGAATILYALENYDFAPLGVNCAIFDCGYDNFSYMTKILLKKHTKMHWFWSYSGIKWLFILKDKINIEKINLIGKTHYTANTPVLFIHGLLDELVPLTMTQKIYEEKIKTENKKIESKILLFPQAKHIDSIISNYDVYEKQVLRFVNLYMSKKVERKK